MALCTCAVHRASLRLGPAQAGLGPRMRGPPRMNGNTMSGLTLDIIARVSKRGSRERLKSDKQQVADCRARIIADGNTPGAVHVAIDSSAGHGKHPAIEEAKRRALSGESDGCVSAYLSRSFRNTVYGLETVKAILDAGKVYLSLDCPFDLNTPEGEKYLTDKLSQAQLEWRMYKENFDRNVREAIESGCHINVPFGYQRSDGQGSPLEPNPTEAPTVTEAGRLRADGWSWPRIAQELNASWCPPRPTTRTLDGKRVTWQAQWNHTTVAQMLKVGANGENVYRGWAFSKPYLNKAAHAPLIDPDTWALIIAARGVRPNRPQDGYELTGLVRCASCGFAMVHSNEGNGQRYYRCKRRMGDTGRCLTPVHIHAKDLEDAVMGEFADTYLKSEAVGEEVDTGESRAQAAVEATRNRFQAVMDTWARARELTGGLSGDQEAREAAAVQAASVAARQAEAELHRVRAAARGNDLLGPLTIKAFNDAPADERRYYMSLVYRAIVCRPSDGWREAASKRYTILTSVGEGPSNGMPLIREILALAK